MRIDTTFEYFYLECELRGEFHSGWAGLEVEFLFSDVPPWGPGISKLSLNPFYIRVSEGKFTARQFIPTTGRLKRKIPLKVTSPGRHPRIGGTYYGGPESPYRGY